MRGNGATNVDVLPMPNGTLMRINPRTNAIDDRLIQDPRRVRRPGNSAIESEFSRDHS
jgi:hypothetical protein